MKSSITSGCSEVGPRLTCADFRGEPCWKPTLHPAPSLYVYTRKRPSLGVELIPAATPGPSEVWLPRKGLGGEEYGCCHTAPGTSGRQCMDTVVPSLQLNVCNV